MVPRFCRLVTFVGFWAIAVSPAAAQVTGAIISESTDVVLNVDREHPLADDGNDGSLVTPLATIGEGVRRAMVNRAKALGTTIRVHPGIYRETVRLDPPTLDPRAPTIIIEGTGPGESIIAGSDVWSAWEPTGAGLWQRAWTEHYGLAMVPEGWGPVSDLLESQPIVRRREVVFIDGQLLRQVLTQAEVESGSGTFRVREVSGGPGVITLHPAPATDMSTATVEVGLRPKTLVIDRMTNLVVRNLTLRHANSELESPSVMITSSEHVLIDACHIEWNNWNGLSVFRSDAVTLRDVRANWNGAGGVTGWRVRNLLVAGTEASHNNWRGARGGFHGWAVGQKFLSTHGARFVDYRATANEATGLWLDVDIEDVTIERAEITDNWRGMFLEAFQGPVVLRDSAIRNNRGNGILTTNAANVTLHGNRIDGNQEYQLVAPWTVDQHELRVERNFETGRFMDLRMENWTITENVFGARDDAMLLGVGLWETFAASLVSARNQWSHTTPGNHFHLYPTRRDVPEARSFADWQQISGQDLDSTFSLTASPGTCAVGVAPTSATVAAPGGRGALVVSTTTPDCSWSATSDSAWLTVLAGASGSGAGLVTYEVAPHGTVTPRVGSLSVGGRRIAVRQEGAEVADPPCDVVATGSVTLDAGGGPQVLEVATSSAGCALTATSGSDWLQITSVSRSVGSGVVAYLADSNLSPSAREGALAVGGHAVRVVQHGARSGGLPVDVNGDGVGDVLRYDEGGAWVIAPYDDRSSPSLTGVWQPGWSTIASDFDADGYTDLLLYSLETGQWRRGMNDRQGDFDWLGATWRPSLVVRALDLNGDGRSDVFLFDRDTGEWAQALMPDDASKDFTYHLGRWAPGWDLFPVRLTLIDRFDLILYNGRTGAWQLAVSDGTGGFRYRGGHTSPGWDLYPGDYDGDGVEDVFLYDARAGDWTLAFTRGDEFQLVTGKLATGWAVRAGDLDGDGDDDLFLYDPATGAWSQCTTDGLGPSSCVSGRWTPGQQIWLTDLNADRQADVLLYEPDTGAYRVAVNNGSGRFVRAEGHWGRHQSVVAVRSP